MIASRQYVKDMITKVLTKLHIPMKNEFYYKSGDTIYEFVLLCGAITGSGKQLIFKMNTPKILKNVSSFTLTQLLGNVRAETYYIGSSAYVEDGTNILTSLSTNSVTKMDNKSLNINLIRSSAWTNGSTTCNSLATFEGYITIKIN